jgi:hypothetical protein
MSLAVARDQLDQWQRRWSPVGFAVAVGKKFVDDRGLNLIQIAYWGFFSVFALLVASRRSSVSSSMAIHRSSRMFGTPRSSKCLSSGPRSAGASVR